MKRVKNPVEQRIKQFYDLWMAHARDEHIRIVVWRLRDGAERLLQAFIRIQEHSGEWKAPDLFLTFALPFETSFLYSHGLRQGLIEGYLDYLKKEGEEGNLPLWQFSSVPAHDSAVGFLELLASFATHVKEQTRYVAAVLAPSLTTAATNQAFDSWLEAAVRFPIPEKTRLILIDTDTAPRWEALAKQYPAIVRVIDVDINITDVMRETAAQTGGLGADYRLLTTDMMGLLIHGTAAQAAERANKAMAVVQQKKKAYDQQAALHMVVAGAYLKEQKYAESIKRYRLARESAVLAEPQENPAASTLVMQTWFGEGGAFVAGHRYRDAVQPYQQAAASAQKIPNPLFSIEGFRMAGYCLAQEKQIKEAYAQYLGAVHQAMPLTPQERALTSLPLVFQDLLRLADSERTRRIEQCANEYQKKIAKAYQQAEERARKLGDHPAQSDLIDIEAEMCSLAVKYFELLQQQREKLIQQGSKFFREVIRTAREMLHSAWNGLPEVKHPLGEEDGRENAKQEVATETN